MHDHAHGDILPAGFEVNNAKNTKFKIGLFSEEEGSTYTGSDDVQEATAIFQHLLTHAIEDHAKDGKMREVSVIIGTPIQEEKRIVCPRCKASGADIFLIGVTYDSNHPRGLVDCESCKSSWEVTKEEFEAERDLRKKNLPTIIAPLPVQRPPLEDMHTGEVIK